MKRVCRRVRREEEGCRYLDENLIWFNQSLVYRRKRGKLKAS